MKNPTWMARAEIMYNPCGDKQIAIMEIVTPDEIPQELSDKLMSGGKFKIVMEG